MDIDEAVVLTQDRLAEEGGTMGELLGHFRNKVSPVLIGDTEWERILECARALPITMGALPFGFELPLHARAPAADFGASLASGTRTAAFFRERARTDNTDETARAIVRLFSQMDAEHSPLRDIVGRKLMLEYDIGSARDGGCSLPGMFLRPGERPIVGAGGQVNDVGVVADALASCLGWETNGAQRENVERVYLSQPGDTRMDSFGVFPSRSRAVRLAIMGFKSQHCQDRGEYRRPGRGARPDARPHAYRQAEIYERLTVLARWPDGLGPVSGSSEPRGSCSSGEASGACGLGLETDHALRQVRALCAAKRHSPHQAGHLGKSAAESESLRVHGAFRSGRLLMSDSCGRAVPTRRRPFSGCICHSDRGLQRASTRYRELLLARGLGGSRRRVTVRRRRHGRGLLQDSEARRAR